MVGGGRRESFIRSRKVWGWIGGNLVEVRAGSGNKGTGARPSGDALGESHGATGEDFEVAVGAAVFGLSAEVLLRAVRFGGIGDSESLAIGMSWSALGSSSVCVGWWGPTGGGSPPCAAGLAAELVHPGVVV